MEYFNIMSSDPIFKLYELASSFNLCQISHVVLGNPKFSIWSGASSPNTHHYGKGGLAQHTLEVVELCLANNNYFKTLEKGVDSGLLFLAALFHDSGKMWDYQPTNPEYTEWKASSHKKLIHHITRSALVWNEAANKCKLDGKDPMSCRFTTEQIDDITHAILAHHGQRECGSPVTPNTRMAWLLHTCDHMSARLDDCYRK